MTKEKLTVPARPMRLIGFAAVTPLGFDAATTAREVAAGTLRIAETEVDDGGGQPARALRSPLIPATATRIERVSALAASALRDHLERIAPVLAAQGIEAAPLVLALPEFQGAAADVDGILSTLARTAHTVAPKLRVEIMRDEIVAAGRASFFPALARAVEWLDSKRARVVIIGGVDALTDSGSLTALAGAGRILGARNSDGLIPGEGAGFALLVSADVKIPADFDALELIALAVAREPQPFLAHEPSQAQGLTATLRALRTQSRAGARRADHLLSAQTGESYWADELARAYLRNVALMPEPFTVSIVAHGLGELGVAAGFVQLAAAPYHVQRLANARGRTGFFAGDVDRSPSNSASTDALVRLLMYAASDSGETGACLVEGRCLAPNAAPSAPGAAAAAPDTSALLHSAPALELGAAICLDHFEEIGFLLDQRRVYFADPQIAWRDVAQLEERIGLHVAALRAWGVKYVDGVIDPALANEFGADTLRGAIFALGSLGLESRVTMKLAAAFQSAQEPTLAVWIYSLALARDSRLDVEISRCLGSEHPAIAVATAKILGMRRMGDATALAKVLADARTPPDLRDAVSVSLAKLGAESAAPAIERAWRANPASPHLFYAALGLIGMGARDEARRALEADANVDPRLYVLYALGGDLEAASFLLRLRPPSESHRRARCVALGIIGSPAAMPALIESLAEESELVRRTAADALARITAAELREKIWLPDHEGAEPGDGKWLERASTEPAPWEAWWRANARAFATDQRYRRGRPFTLRLCWEEAHADSTSQMERQLAIDEVCVRTRRPFSFAADDFIDRQLDSLAALEASCSAKK
ncbi:MAG: HEAT repeat domain-containing protein [Planctomycetota bacterium]